MWTSFERREKQALRATKEFYDTQRGEYSELHCTGILLWWIVVLLNLKYLVMDKILKICHIQDWKSVCISITKPENSAITVAELNTYVNMQPHSLLKQVECFI